MTTDELPSNLKYTQTHEWVRLDGDIATVGVTAYAAEELGDVVFLDLPWDDAGTRDLEASGHFGDIESVKATSELFSPVSGALLSVNDRLRDQPELVNTSPYDEGWMITVRVSDPAQLDGLMDSAAYEKYTASLH
ncbi:MAG TPA: glycine cleavage system protein GcvH [Ktedonobacterales bacterium]|nr:glycine cleavage system protein GcvH [Ktedonobacterales bacterium]